MTILRSLGRALASNPVPVLRYVRDDSLESLGLYPELLGVQREADDLVHRIRRQFSGADRRKLIEFVCDSLRKMDAAAGRGQCAEAHSQFQRYTAVRMIGYARPTGKHLRAIMGYLAG